MLKVKKDTFPVFFNSPVFHVVLVLIIGAAQNSRNDQIENDRLCTTEHIKHSKTQG